MMAQLTGVSAMLKDAFRAQMRALLLTLSSLRSANARLQLDAEWVQHHRDTGGVGGDVTSYSSSLHAPSSLRLERECLKTACAEAQGAYKGENSAVQLALRRLSHLIDVIRNDVASLHQDRYGWEQRCQRAEAASHQTGAASHGALAGSKAQVQQTSETHAMSSDVDMAQLFRISQERCARVEQALQESQRLCSQVERVHALAFSTPAAHEMQWAGYELVELLGTHVKAPGPKSAMEEVLAEQAETIAGLRVDLRQQREARKQVEVRLRDSERQRQLLEHECAAFQDQIRSTAKRVDVQKNGSKAFSSSPTAIAMTSNPIPPVVAARSASKQAMTGDSAPGVASHRVESMPCHSGARVQDSVLHSPGSLRSPITSDDKASEAEECHRFDRTHRRYTTLLHCHASPSLSLSNSLSSSPSNVVIEEIDGPKALAEQQSFLRRCPAVSVASLIRNTRSWAAPCSTSSGSSLLLSATELERRKQEILHKYDAA
ncbi:hypothetical protein JKF63_00390 [Porcisia hertigi]|uniref:Uncharacterized protein n=1 Tax=Porcisia hertigi TaxID=2761500 RepID=A0A836I862_9TRYP|nr:hypothetical protein JKF63_00390 [Porcisia hertigi]